MSNIHDEQLETRLNRIEKSANRWRIATVSLLALIGIGVMAGQANRQAVSRDLLQHYLGQPTVVGIAPVTHGLVRVWSDGTTEMMGKNTEFNGLFDYTSDVDENDLRLVYGFDYESQQWWPAGRTTSMGEPAYSSDMYWRPFVDEDLSAP